LHISIVQHPRTISCPLNPHNIPTQLVSAFVQANPDHSIYVRPFTMTPLLYTSLLATTAIAVNITTSVWLPGAANANQTFLGSVVQQSDDQTVLALAFANTPSTPDYFRSAPDQVTLGGSTFVAYNVSATDSKGDNAAVAAVTIQLECRRPSGGVSAVPTCTLSTLGSGGLVSAICAGLSVSLPEYCTASSAVNVEQTQTFSGEYQYYINNYPLIITAGTEKLKASVAAAPSVSNASVTGSSPVPGAAGGSAAAAAPSPTSSGVSPSAPQATGAAAPVKTMAPALIGLGAAVGAFFL
jgi:hypothetical protein